MCRNFEIVPLEDNVSTLKTAAHTNTCKCILYFTFNTLSVTFGGSGCDKVYFFNL